jgi:restriction system protein
MESFGPECASLILQWLRAHAAGLAPLEAAAGAKPVQAMLFQQSPYQEEAPAILDARELTGAIEHLEYAVFRRFHNQLTRAERTRLDNTIENAIFKIERYLSRADEAEAARHHAEVSRLTCAVRDSREQIQRQHQQARRADLKIAQLDSLDPESFEMFVAELFEGLGFEVEHVGASGDEGADLRLSRKDGLRAVVQCKYHKQGVVGSPVLQRFLGTIHHTRSHKGYFVTTSTFSLAAEKFVAEHPIELVDGPRLIELIEQALGPRSKRRYEPSWF